MYFCSNEKVTLLNSKHFIKNLNSLWVWYLYWFKLCHYTTMRRAIYIPLLITKHFFLLLLRRLSEANVSMFQQSQLLFSRNYIFSPKARNYYFFLLPYEIFIFFLGCRAQKESIREKRKRITSASITHIRSGRKKRRRKKIQFQFQPYSIKKLKSDFIWLFNYSLKNLI